MTLSDAITAEAVRDALRSIRLGRVVGSSDLLRLKLVDHALQSLDVPDTHEARAQLLKERLELLVRERLAALRGEEQPGAAETAGLETRLEALRADFAGGSKYREAWGVLHFRFFSGSSHSVKQLARTLGVADSTFRRRVSLGYRLLADALHGLELEAALLPSQGRAHQQRQPSAKRHNLLDPATPLVGRDEDRASIAETIQDHRCVTLVGPGGAGKTRLALQVALDARDDWPDGVWMVPLAPIQDPRLIASTVAASMALEGMANVASGTGLANALADARCLLVLDNCEHLRAACGELATLVLAKCPGVHVLSTSRQPLGVAGERIIRVPPLGVPPEADMTDLYRVETSPAVQLFVQRALAQDSSFRLTQDNAEDVARICRALDGLPLALELAAARVAFFGTAGLLENLDDRLTLLRSGSSVGPDRHQTLVDCLDWSHALLPPVERALFRRLSVFKGGWDLDAMTTVAADGLQDSASALHHLAELADKSLVLRVSPTSSPLGPRFKLLETVRAYAAERLEESDEADRIRQHHRQYYAELASTAAERLTGEDQRDWLDRLLIDQDNLRQAFDSACRHDIPLATEFAANMTQFWKLRGRPEEGREWFDRILKVNDPDVAPDSRAAALDGAGALAFQQGDYEAARELHGASLELKLAAGDQAAIGETLRHLGNTADAVGDYALARKRYLEALGYFDASSDDWNYAAALNNLGLVDLRLGQLEGAREHLLDALGRFRQQGADWAVAVTLSNLAEIDLAQQDRELARERFAESLRLSRQLDDRDGEAYALTGMANVERLWGHVGAARRYLARSLSIWKSMGSQTGAAEWLESAALLLPIEGRITEAVQCLAAADTIRDRTGSPLPPKDMPAVEDQLARLRDDLGPAFDDAWREGGSAPWTLTAEQALQALDSVSPAG